MTDEEKEARRLARLAEAAEARLLASRAAERRFKVKTDKLPIGDDERAKLDYIHKQMMADRDGKAALAETRAHILSRYTEDLYA